MKCKIEKSKLYGSLTCPSNEFYTHYSIFIASLADGKSIIKNMLVSSNTVATIEACKSFGVNIQNSNNDLIIKNSITDTVHSSAIDVNYSTTTLYVASAIASLINGKSALSGENIIKKTSIQPLLDALESIGVKTTSQNGRPPITITGKTDGGVVLSSKNISSELVDALLIISPRTKNGITIEFKDGFNSKLLSETSRFLMKKFGVKVKTGEKQFKIIPQKYKPTTVTIPSDFFCLAVLLSSTVLLSNKLELNITIGDIPHPYEVFIDMLERLGVDLYLVKNKITITSPKMLMGGTFDLSNAPKLLPILAILALKSSRPIKIINLDKTDYPKEKLKHLAEQFKKIGLRVKENHQNITIERLELTSADLDSKDDDTLFMVFCIVGMYIGNCTVTQPKSISTYPEFVSDIKKVGGEIQVEITNKF